MDLDCDRPPPSADMKSSDSEASELLREAFLRKKDMISLFFFRTKSTIQEDPRGFNAIEIDVFIQKGNVRLLLQTITRARSLFSQTTEGRADLSLKNLKYLLTSLSRRNSAERERERDLLESERKKRETLLETICARA